MKDIDFKSSKTGILLLSHGSKLPQGKYVIEAYVNMFKVDYPDAIIDYAFMELREPTIPQSIAKLAENNDLERIIVVPVFVAHGLHTKRDIPKILGIESDFNEEDIHSHEHHHHDHDHGHHHHHHHEVETVDFDGEIILTDPLGIDTRLYKIIKERVEDNF